MNEGKLTLTSPEAMLITQDDINLCLGSGELMPCPFCGRHPPMSSGINIVGRAGKAVRWTIQCSGGSGWPDCFGSVLAVEPDLDKARQQAVERWNRRSTPPPSTVRDFQIVHPTAEESSVVQSAPNSPEIPEGSKRPTPGQTAYEAVATADWMTPWHRLSPETQKIHEAAAQAVLKAHSTHGHQTPNPH